MTFTTIKIYIYFKSPETCRDAGPDAVEPLNHIQGHLLSDSVLGEKVTLYLLKTQQRLFLLFASQSVPNRYT